MGAAPTAPAWTLPERPLPGHPAAVTRHARMSTRMSSAGRPQGRTCARLPADLIAGHRDMRNCSFVGAALLVIACAGGPTADAQTYPTRPITMVVPFAAGGPTDTITRIVAERMRASLGQT